MNEKAPFHFSLRPGEELIVRLVGPGQVIAVQMDQESKISIAVAPEKIKREFEMDHYYEDVHGA